MVETTLKTFKIPIQIIRDLQAMIAVTGEVKATEMLFDKIMEGIVAEKKGTLKTMAKDLVSKPLFEALIKWLSNTDDRDFINNRVYIYNSAIYCRDLFKDIYGIKEKKKYGPRKSKVPVL